MLALSRKVGERIVIGDSVTVTVRSIDGGRIGLAIEAPKHVAIVRDEAKAKTRKGD